MIAGQGGSQVWSAASGSGVAEEAEDVAVEPVSRAEAARLAGCAPMTGATPRAASVAVVEADSIFAERLEQAWRYFQENKIGQALTLARDLAWQMPSPAGAKLLLARCFIRRREYDKALDILDSIPGPSRTPEILYYIGVSLGRLGRREEALEQLRRSRAASGDPFLRKRAHDLQIQLGGEPAKCPACGKPKLYHPDAAVDNDPLCAVCRDKAVVVPPQHRSTAAKALLTLLILLFALFSLSLFLPVWNAGRIAWLRSHLPFLTENLGETLPPPDEAHGMTDESPASAVAVTIENGIPNPASPPITEYDATPPPASFIAPPEDEPDPSPSANPYEEDAAEPQAEDEPAASTVSPAIPENEADNGRQEAREEQAKPEEQEEPEQPQSLPPPPEAVADSPPAPASTLAEPSPSPVPYQRWLNADMDNDGIDDLVWVGVAAEHRSGIRFFRNRGGGFICVANYPLEPPPIKAELVWKSPGSVLPVLPILIVTDADDRERRFLFCENRIIQSPPVSLFR